MLLRQAMDVALVGLACVAGAFFVLFPLPSAFFALFTVWLVRKNVGRTSLAVAFIIAGIQCVRCSRSFHEAKLRDQSAHDNGHGLQSCEGEGTITASPVWVHALRVQIKTSSLVCEGSRETLHGFLFAYIDENAPLVRGDTIRFAGMFAAKERFANDATYMVPLLLSPVARSGSISWFSRTKNGSGPQAWIDTLRFLARARVLRDYDARYEALARALLIGESDLSDEDNEAFRASGLSHLLAVSGTHLIIAVGTITRILELLLVRIQCLALRIDIRRLAAFFSIPVAIFYADFAGGSGSAWRAAITLAIQCLAVTFARKVSSGRSLALTLVATGICNPWAALDFSFLLSTAAGCGLIVFSRPVEKTVAHFLPDTLRWIAAPLAATIAATIACAPCILLLSNSLPIATIGLNVIAGPLGELCALPACIVQFIASPIRSAATGAATIASGALAIVLWCARLGAALPGLPCPSPNAWQLATCLATLVVVVVARSNRRGIAAYLVLAIIGLECLHRYARTAKPSLRVTFLDVGQGDSALVEFPNGQAALIDAGGFVGSPIDTGSRVVAPFLRGKRISTLAFVALSHPHPDHFGGLAAGLQEIKVGEAWDTGQGEAEQTSGKYAEWLARMRLQGTPVIRPGCSTRMIGETQVSVLAPCPTFDPDEGPNNNSLVIRIEYRGRSILFVGDSEEHAEERLVATVGPGLHSDILKVGHHGSRTSSGPPFLDAVSPKFAVISTGVRNRFGHPHQATLSALSERGIRAYRTDLVGAVTMETTGKEWAARTVVVNP